MCAPWDPGGCVSDIAGKVADSVFGALTDAIVEAINKITQMALTFWMNPALSPTVANVEQGTATNNVSVLQDALQTMTVVAAVIGILFACAQVAITHRAAPLVEVGKMFLAVITASGLAAVAVQIGIIWGDEFSPWIIQQATGADYDSGAADLFPETASAGISIFLLLFMGGLVVLAGLAQVAFMLFRAGVLPILLAVLPVVAAMTANDAGRTWMKKICGWLLAFVLYKPVAALIYAGGFATIRSASMRDFLDSGEIEDGIKPVFQVLSGLVILILAVLVLPAMIKLVAPLAATGSSSMFSGAAAAGAVVTGAVAVGTLGAGAAAGAAGTAGAAGAAGTSGTGAAGAAGTAGTTGAASAPGGAPAVSGAGAAPEAPSNASGPDAGQDSGSSTGAQGSPSRDGIDGKDGRVGQDGSPGHNGSNGSSGPGSGSGSSAGGGTTLPPAPPVAAPRGSGVIRTAPSYAGSGGGRGVGRVLETKGAADNLNRSINDAVDGYDGPGGSR